MKLLSWTIISFMFMSNLTAQSLQVSSDSTKNYKYVLSYKELLPPDFKIHSSENLFYSDSNSTTNADNDYFFILRLRGNCTFFYEVYHDKKDSVRVGYYIGKYTVIKKTIHLFYEPMLSGAADKIYLSPVTPVSWTLPKRPEYFVIKNKILIETGKKRRATTTHLNLQDKLQFDIGTCN